jgi:hypothetical protein
MCWQLERTYPSNNTFISVSTRSCFPMDSSFAWNAFCLFICLLLVCYLLLCSHQKSPEYVYINHSVVFHINQNPNTSWKQLKKAKENKNRLNSGKQQRVKQTKTQTHTSTNTQTHKHKQKHTFTVNHIPNRFKTSSC